jgi:DNA-directed RNA polymerase specialized sigma24 family protein
MNADDGLGAGVEVVLKSLYPGMLRFAGVVGSAGVEPADLVQEAVLRTLRVHPNLDFADPGAYLRRAILSVAKNRSRAAAHRRLIMRRLATETATTASFPSDLHDLFRLAPETRAVLYLTVVEGQTHAEAAAIVGCTESAARARSSRGLRRLREQLTEEARND